MMARKVYPLLDDVLPILNCHYSVHTGRKCSTIYQHVQELEQYLYLINNFKMLIKMCST